MENEIVKIDNPLLINALGSEDIEQAQFVLDTVSAFVKKNLQPKRDFGIIQGCGNKPVLYKAGAEKLIKLFKLRPEFEIIEKIIDYDRPLFHFHYKCSLYRYGEYLGASDAIASSMETKYQRKVLICPHCGQGAVFKDKSKNSYYCYTKKGGCGANNILSKDLKEDSTFDFSQINTIAKMSQKRAMVGAVLIVCGVSEHFTQELDTYK